MRRPPVLPTFLAAALLAACGGAPAPEPAGEPAPSPPEEAAAETASSAQPAPVRESAPATQPAAAPARPEANGTSRVVLELSEPFEMAGFELHLSFDGSQFAAEAAEKTAALDGFLCQDNPNLSGGYKIICARIPAASAEGRLAVIPFTWAERPLERGDLTVDAAMVVDADSTPAPEGVELTLAVE